MDIFICPVHFRNVNKTFNAFLNLNKTAIVCNIADLATELGTFRIAASNFLPWIITKLLQTQGNAVALAIELQHLDVDLVTDLDHFGGQPGCRLHAAERYGICPSAI